MNLYIVRHAIAEQRQESASEAEDSQRPLTDKGRKKFRKVARGLRDLGVGIDMILTSPYVRAADTAAILRKQLKLGKEQLDVVQDIAPGGDAARLIAEISQKYGTLEGVAIVGHETGLSRLVSMLLYGDPSLPITLKKGGVCCLTVDKLEYGRCATLQWLMAPSQMESFAG